MKAIGYGIKKKIYTSYTYLNWMFPARVASFRVVVIKIADEKPSVPVILSSHVVFTLNKMFGTP